MQSLVMFLKDVRVELAKVSWPTRRETVRYTLIVIGMSFGFAVFLGLLDSVFTYVLNAFLLK